MAGDLSALDEAVRARVEWFCACFLRAGRGLLLEVIEDLACDACRWLEGDVRRNAPVSHLIIPKVIHDAVFQLLRHRENESAVRPLFCEDKAS